MSKHIKIENAYIFQWPNIFIKDEKVRYAVELTKEQYLRLRNVYNLNAHESKNCSTGEPVYWIRVYPSLNYRVPSEKDFLMRNDIDVTFYLHCSYIKDIVEHYILIFDKDNITEHKNVKNLSVKRLCDGGAKWQ